MMGKPKRVISSIISIMLLISIVTPYTAQAHHQEEIYTNGEFANRWDVTTTDDNITINVDESIDADGVVLNVECTENSQWKTFFSIDKETAWDNGTNTRNFTVTKSEDGYIELDGIKTKALDGTNSNDQIYLYVITKDWYGYGNNRYKKKYYEYNLSEAAKQKLGFTNGEVQEKGISILEIQPNHSFELNDSIFNSYDEAYEISLTQMSMPEFISKVEDINGKYDVVYIGNKVQSGVGYSDKGDKYPSNKNLPQGGKNGVEYYSGIDITNRRADKVKEFIESGQLMLFSSNIFNNSDLHDTKLYKNFSTYVDFDNVKLLDDTEEYFSHSNNSNSGGNNWNNWNRWKYWYNYSDGYGWRNSSRWNDGNNNVEWNNNGRWNNEDSDDKRKNNGRWNDEDNDDKWNNNGRWNDEDNDDEWNNNGRWNNENNPNGLRGNYYNLSKHFSTDWSWKYYATHKMTRVDSEINFDWGEGSPQSDKVRNDRFLVRWTGKIRPEHSEEYTFYTSTDDGVRLWLKKDNRYIKLIDKWQDQSETEWQSEDIELEAGKLYDIVMDFYENGVYAAAKLKWSSPSQSKEIIPNERLYLPRYRDNQGSNDPSFLNDYSASNMRPILDLITKPKEYTGDENSYQTDKILSFGFDVYNNNSGEEMTAKLYLDINGDGIFKSDEVVEEISNINTSTGYSINHRVDESFTGLNPWKLELIDDETGAKTYRLGSTAFKGEPLKVRVLQLTPYGNTLPLNNLKNVNGLNLLEKDGEYEIEIIEMPVNQFDQNYPNPYNGNPTVLNGNYDMIIFGFADIYGGENLTRQESINAVKGFIETDQSVMFTHDTMTFRVNDVGGWAYYLTKEFRDLIGQNIYLNEDKPNPSKTSYGFSRLTLDRARYNQFFTTTGTYKMNDGLLTQYPYILGDINVASTHFQYFQLDLEDEEIVPWYTLTGDSRLNKYDGRNDYYTYTKGNITYSGTGHSTPNRIDEQKLFINTMIKASRGANHAPTLEVYGISDGQNIMPSEETINFTIKAEDVDVRDSNLTANVYINDNLISTFEFEKGKQIPISVSNSLTEETEEFTLKIVVKDSANAEAVKEIKLSHLSIPTLALDTSMEKGYLVGDTVELGFSIHSEDTEKNDLIDDISLETNIDSSSFDVLNRNGWSKSGSKYYTDPTLEDNTRVLTLKTLSEGENQITSKLEYSALGEAVELERNTLIDVKSGSIDIEVVDNVNRGKEGVNIEVRKPDGSIIDIETNETGLYTINGLSSGTYEVTMDIPNGYSNSITNTKEITLSYDYNAQEVKFLLEGSPVSSITRTLPEVLNISEYYEIVYTVDGDTVVYDESSAETLELKEFQYDEAFPAGIDILEYPEGIDRTGSLDTGYRLQGNIDAIKMKKVNSGEPVYKVEGEFRVKIISNVADTYTFSQAKINYKDPFTIEGEVIVDGGIVEIIDDVPPLKPVITALPTEPTNQNVVVTISVGEEVSRIEYKLSEDRVWTEYTSEFEVSENTTIYAKAFDPTGNESEIAELEIANIDKEAPGAPTIQASLTEPTNQDVTVTITVNEIVERIEYKLGANGAWTEYTGSFDVLENTTVYSRAIDNAGNVSDLAELIISNIDKETPNAPSIHASTTEPTNEDVSITITIVEEVDSIEYRLGTSEEWMEYTTSLDIVENTIVYARAIDISGNISDVAELQITNIDKEAPEAPVVEATPSRLTNGDVSIAFTAEENATIEYRIGDSGEWTEYTGDVILTDNNVVYAKATDLAGNVSDESQFTVDYIDKSTTDYEFISGVNREDSIFKIGRITSKFSFKLNNHVDKIAFKLKFESDNENILDIISILNSSLTINSDEHASIIYNEEDNSITIMGPLSAGNYEIEFPVEINYLTQVEDTSFEIKIIQFKVNDNEEFTDIDSPQSINKINIKVIELPKLL